MASQESSPALRLTFLTVLVIVLFVALFSRLWFLQVLAGERYVELAESNRVRIVTSEAPRGDIVTADGEELVTNRPALTISAERRRLLDDQGEPQDAEAEAVLDRLSRLLEMDVGEIVERLSSVQYSPFRPVPIAHDVDPSVMLTVREQQERYPGVVAETLPVREYPQGQLAAHLVGYIGEVTPEQLDDEAFADYRAGDTVGRFGLEQTYEHVLRGEQGQRRYEVNAQGTVLEVLSEREPRSGNDVRLSVDLDLQEAAEQLLADGIEASRGLTHSASGRSLPSVAGSAVVLDADDASVKAMASYPTFDPREFVGGVSTEYFDEINPQEPPRPMLNRAISEAYPPGSVFKVITGATAFEFGVEPDDYYSCAPSYSIGSQDFRNWNRGVHEGAMDLSTALMRSCDTYFYEIFHDIWQHERDNPEQAELLPTVADRFGLDQELGIDLPNEISGIIPSREWKRDYWEANRDGYCQQAGEYPDGSYPARLYGELCESGHVWRPGDAVNTSIGQGDISTTPLQIAAAYTAIANGGTLYQPQVADAILQPSGEVAEEITPEVVDELGLDDAELEEIRSGLERVVMAPRGTATGAFAGFPLDEIPVAGKTGTAEAGERVPHAWFAAYAPADDPEIVVVVQVEQGGGGGQTAAPIARNILEHYFDETEADEAEFEAGPATSD